MKFYLCKIKFCVVEIKSLSKQCQGVVDMYSVYDKIWTIMVGLGWLNRRSLILSITRNLIKVLWTLNYWESPVCTSIQHNDCICWKAVKDCVFDWTQILETGQEMNELDHSGFSTQTTTIYAGNIGGDRYILQVSDTGLRLLEGGKWLYYLLKEYFKNNK